MKKRFNVEAIDPSYAYELCQLSDMILQKKMSSDTASKLYEVDEESRSYQVLDGIAVYRVSGPIMTSGDEWTRFFGIADYESIRADFIAMGRDPEVTEILMLAASPGGAVSGVSNAATAIQKVGAVKGVYTYTGANCCSGMYWLAAPSKEILMSPEAKVGSIGVITTHVSEQKALEDAGYKVTVFRSQELKAVGGEYKDLTDAEIKHIQEQVDQYDELFRNHIKAVRPNVSLASMKGETFIGAEAVKVGLADAVMDFDSAINYIKSKRQTQTQQGGYSMKMTAQQLQAALDAGQTTTDMGLTDAEVAEILAAVTAEGEGEAQEPEAEAAEPDQELQMKAEVERLGAEVAAKVSILAEQAAEIEGLKAKLAAVPDVNADLKKIVCEITSNRRTALGLQDVDMSEFSVTSVLAEYSAVSKQYMKSFASGGLAGIKAQRQAASVGDVDAELTNVQAGQFKAVAL